MKRERPINAELPELPPEVGESTLQEEAAAPPRSEPGPRPEAAPERQPRTSPPPPPRPRRRQPGPLTPKLLAALVLLAVAFIVAALLGGTGGSGGGSGQPAPAPVAADGGEARGPEQLGYPTFATNNTTRVGGADPTTIAAATALAVYPATTASQRPAAVALASEHDWAGAIAAAVLMAEPVRAPLLFAAADGVPDPTSEALAALDPAGDAASAGAAVFAIGDVSVPSAAQTTRIAAGSPAAEAAAIANLRDRLSGSAPAHVVVAPSSRPDLAAPAAAWAARSGDPVLFTGPGDLPAATASALRRHRAVPVYVLGPPSAISSEVLRAIGAIVKSVKRVSGKNAVANAIALARYHDGAFGWNVNDPGHGFVLARDDSPLDAAAAAALSGSGTWGPLLLTDSATKLPAELRSYFLDVKPGYTDNPTRAFYNHVWVIGDQEAIDVHQQAEANELAELARIGGEG